jgi:hypothetical protein
MVNVRNGWKGDIPEPMITGMPYLPIWPLLLAVTGATGDPPCEAASAVPVTIAELATEPSRYKGRCVAVMAPASYWSLFSSMSSLERQLRSSNRVLVRRSERRRQIGWYHPPGELDPQVELGLKKAWCSASGVSWTIASRFTSGG